jgi:energy-coupling factor transporter ATP-binding protein EcfA2
MAESRSREGIASRRTIGERLGPARSTRFAGRGAELALFAQALADPGSAFTVLFVQGPPGVGKSTLLRTFATLAAEHGRRVVSLDLREVEPSPDGVRTALEARGAWRGDTVDADVLLLDTYELASAVDGWIRESLVATLPADAIVVIAGRLPPSPGWLADPGWRPLMRVVGLRNLRPEDAQQLLLAEGLDGAHVRRVVDETYGHPLALRLYIDLLIQRREQGSGTDLDGGLLDAPDTVRALLDRFVEEVPTPAHRAALEVCAHVRFTTEDLLRAAVDVPATEAAGLFDWLRSLSFVETSRHGLFPHDLARDLLDSDLRWRNPSAYEALHRRVRRQLIQKVRSDSPRERQRAAVDLVFLHRSNPLMRPFWDFTGLSQGYADRYQPEDRDALHHMVLRHEGPESASIFEHWLQRQPEAFTVMRVGTETTPRGFTALIRLHDATAQDLAADPAAAAMWDHVQRQTPVAPGEMVTACRFLVDRDAHQAPGSLTFGLTAAQHLQHMLTRVERAMDFIGGIAQRDQLEAFFDYIDFHAVADATYEVDGRSWTVFCRSWRGAAVDTWFELVADRELGTPVEPAAADSAETTIALSQPDFAGAVRGALRDLHRLDRLRGNPLVRSRLVGTRTASDAPAALAAAVREAVEALATDPRREKYHRALDRTFVHAAPTQERAAEVLDLPFSTYRRHLTRGIELVIASLWDQELYGPMRASPEHEVSNKRSGG